MSEDGDGWWQVVGRGGGAGAGVGDEGGIGSRELGKRPVGGLGGERVAGLVVAGKEIGGWVYRGSFCEERKKEREEFERDGNHRC